MKKHLIIVMLICSMRVFSLDHGLISGFEVGYTILGGIYLNNKLIINDKDTIFIEMKTGYRIEGLRLLGTYTNTLYQS